MCSALYTPDSRCSRVGLCLEGVPAEAMTARPSDSGLDRRRPGLGSGQPTHHGAMAEWSAGRSPRGVELAEAPRWVQVPDAARAFAICWYLLSLLRPLAFTTERRRSRMTPGRPGGAATYTQRLRFRFTAAAAILFLALVSIGLSHQKLQSGRWQAVVEVDGTRCYRLHPEETVTTDNQPDERWPSARSGATPASPPYVCQPGVKVRWFRRQAHPDGCFIAGAARWATRTAEESMSPGSCSAGLGPVHPQLSPEEHHVRLDRPDPVIGRQSTVDPASTVQEIELAMTSSPSGADGLSFAACLTFTHAATRGSTTYLPPADRPMNHKFSVVHFVRRGRYFRTRVAYDGKATATYQCCRLLLLSGDVELNPGPPPPPSDRQSRTATRQTKLSALLHNTQSIRSKLGCLRAGVEELRSYDILALTETWLDETVGDAELEAVFPDHTWFRRDRGSVGGGVACAVRSTLQPIKRTEPDNDTETLLIQLGQVNTTVAVCYRPPSDDLALERMCRCLADLPGGPILVLGDFNLPEIRWESQPGAGARPSLLRNSLRASRFVDYCDLLGLGQYVTLPTRQANILDLVLARGVSDVRAIPRKSIIASDHDELVVSLTVSSVTRPIRVTRSTALNYRRADFDGLRRALSVAPWHMMDGLGVDEAVSMFYTLVDSAVRDHIPVVVCRKKFPPWFDATVRRALKVKQAAFERLKRHPTDRAIKADFVEKRAEFKRVSDRSYTEYLKGLVGEFRTNSKRFWSFVRCFKQSKGLPVLVSNGARVSDDTGKANLLNRTFAAKFSDPDVTVFPEVTAIEGDRLTEFRVSEDNVRILLRNLVVSKACGPDGLSARVLRECADELAAPLCKIFSMSLSSGIFPQQWAEANIVPIFKKGARNNPGNYRSVSLLPLCAKIFEKLISDQLFQHVEPYLSPLQHGFFPNRSCATNLASFLSHGWTAISNKYQLDTVYTDFSSAFQSVNHSLLLYKLEKMYGLNGVALEWVKSYLGRRKQRVVLNGKVSDWVPAVSGTPEGGHISPLLFSLFINDLPTVISTNCLLFADDLKLFNEIRSAADVLALQRDLDAVARWAADWKLVLNASKCKSFKITLKRNFINSSYKINGITLENVTSIRDLGVILDQKLDFAEHVGSIVSKANRALGLIIRTFQSASPRCKIDKQAALAAYNANVRSILEYCSIIWGGAARCHLVRVERVQHKFLMWLTRRTGYVGASLAYCDLLASYGVLHLGARRAQHEVMFLSKVFKGFISSSFLLQCFGLHVPIRQARTMNRALFSLPFARVNTVSSGLFLRIPRTVNHFLGFVETADLFFDSLGQLKRQSVLYVSTLPPVV